MNSQYPEVDYEIVYKISLDFTRQYPEPVIEGLSNIAAKIATVVTLTIHMNNDCEHE